MAKPLSFDLRSRVLAAVDGGLSCRRAAERFGVSASSAIRWAALRRKVGDARPKAVGGDRLSSRTEAHAGLIHAALAETSDITLPELKESSPRTAPMSASPRFGAFAAATRSRVKKDGACLGAGSSRHPDAAGSLVRRSGRPRPGPARLHRRDLGFDQYGAAPRPGPKRAASARRRTARSLENDDIPRRAGHARHDRAVHP